MLRNTHKWLPAYIKDRIAKSARRSTPRPTHIFLAICDHYEPLWNKANYAAGLGRVREWKTRYPAIADRYRDADGAKPKYTFFYPIEEYRSEYMSSLADLCHKGYGEVEVHLHHDNDTAYNLLNTLIRYKSLLADNHSLLSRDKDTGEIRYGFIHGNWAINNSRPDGRWCGVDNELEILRKTGCYADFTMPSAPDITQTSRINSIYRDKGLLMIQGPLMLNWKSRKYGIAPRIENSSIGANNPVTPDRVKLWIDAGIHVTKRPGYIFIKLYTHGCQNNNMGYLLSGGLDNLFSLFLAHYNDGINYAAHFVTAREMVNATRALEDGVAGSVDEMRNYKYIMSMVNVTEGDCHHIEKQSPGRHCEQSEAISTKGIILK